MTAARFRDAWPWFAVLAAGFMLATAHAFEYFGHYPPCELCLRQRDVYWVILGVGTVAAILVHLRPPLLRAACAILALMFLAEAGVAAYHAGVEWKWWPGPQACTGAGARLNISGADLLAGLSKVQHVVRCDEAAFRFLGLSMAGWNCLFALKWTLVSAWCAATARSAHV